MRFGSGLAERSRVESGTERFPQPRGQVSHDLDRTAARVEIQAHDQALASARHFLSLLGQGRSGLTDPEPAGPIETAS